MYIEREKHKKYGEKGPESKRFNQGLHGLNNRAFKKTFNKLITKRQASEPTGPEKRIMLLLLLRRMDFKREHFMEGLVNPKTLQPLFFDFYLPAYTTVIEFDGPYHYKPINGEGALKNQQGRDHIKTLYCAAKGIRLLRIPYTKVDYLEKIINEFFDYHF